MRIIIAGVATVVALSAVLSGCSTGPDETRNLGRVRSALAGSDTLYTHESLGAEQSLYAGNTELKYQSDNNLVLYQNGSAIWATNCWPTCTDIGSPNVFVMQGDCNAVVYGSPGPVWASNTDGQGSSCFARVIEGDWFVCSGTTRVFSARGGGDCGSEPPPPPPPNPTPTPTPCKSDGTSCSQNGDCCSKICNTRTATCSSTPLCIGTGKTGCFLDADCCTAGNTCDMGTCRSMANGSCTWNGDCYGGYVCSYGSCKAPQGSWCFESWECADSLHCVNHTCTTNSYVTTSWGGGGGEERTTWKGCTLHEGDWITRSDCEYCGCSASESACTCSLFMED